MLESFEKERYCSLPKPEKRSASMVCERRSPEGQNRAGRGRASEEVRLMVRTRAESRTLRLLSVVGSTGVTVAPELCIAVGECGVEG